MSATALSPSDLLGHWQGLRALTRRVIERFPEESLFTFAVGGMRPFGVLAAEMLGIAVPMVQEIVGGAPQPFSERPADSKAQLLAEWDAATEALNVSYAKIPEHRFAEVVTLFGQYSGPVWSQLLYAIDNENHHRGQGYVYLRALGIEPPPFWERV